MAVLARNAMDSSDDQVVMALVQVIRSRQVKTTREARKSGNIGRGHLAGHENIIRDYFGQGNNPPIYSDRTFRRRFRMGRDLFLRIVHSVVEDDSYFVQKRDAIGKKGLSHIQKCTSAMRILAYGLSADATDEYCRLGESTSMKSLKRFVDAIVNVFGPKYLREPSDDDIQHHLNQNAARGFPGMFGSIDCTHWEWKNCPVAWQGQYQDREGKRSIILEAIATQMARVYWCPRVKQRYQRI
ncbi:hypothetical protein Ae201684P_007312 [Aphanomyces euteiches]|uniref:DDE Tnp4 domain-containing protein n=1 Tax=Aphanomyces euteiches TaxID=100861 RepID=A0A6G0WV82_9STRA|nr:hypothetical protein Ae201684_011289 [Aphanomyces euteiches]KAH9101127.1 hypothetical protein Ae201684P_007312 [Aphanomyces euteiches]